MDRELCGAPPEDSRTLRPPPKAASASEGTVYASGEFVGPPFAYTVPSLARADGFAVRVEARDAPISGICAICG